MTGLEPHETATLGTRLYLKQCKRIAVEAIALTALPLYCVYCTVYRTKRPTTTSEDLRLRDLNTTLTAPTAPARHPAS